MSGKPPRDSLKTCPGQTLFTRRDVPRNPVHGAAWHTRSRSRVDAWLHVVFKDCLPCLYPVWASPPGPCLNRGRLRQCSAHIGLQLGLLDEAELRVGAPIGEGLVELVEDVASQVQGLDGAGGAQKPGGYTEPHLSPPTHV